MPRLDLETFLDQGIIREESFRQAIASHDWTQYAGKTLFVRGCSDVPIPMWAFMMVAAHAASAGASSILFGEEKRPITVYERR